MSSSLSSPPHSKTYVHTRTNLAGLPYHTTVVTGCTVKQQNEVSKHHVEGWNDHHELKVSESDQMMAR